MSFTSAAQQYSSEYSSDSRMMWDRLLCTERLAPRPNELPHGRTEFEVDYDRLIFSKAFRRLARKTQVHPLAENDHTHNRLTHSLEVASVGRSLGKAAYHIAKKLEPNGVTADALAFAEVVQAACLAHDIGNTPFGHAGERAIRQWMSQHTEHFPNLSKAQLSDLTLYEGNAQAFRMATRSVSEFEEGKTNREYGLGLTAATLATMMKYPWHSDHENAQPHGKYSVFQDDLAAFEWAVNSTGLKSEGNAYSRHPLAFLVEAADDICNAIVDIEDAIELQILKRSEVEDALIQLSGLSENSSVAQMRTRTIGNLIDQCLAVFEQHYWKIMDGKYHSPLINAIDPDMLAAFKSLNTIAVEKVYPFQHNDELEKKCNLMLSRILNSSLISTSIVTAGATDKVLKPIIELQNKTNGEQPKSYRSIMLTMDFVAGMTDNYASSLAERL